MPNIPACTNIIQFDFSGGNSSPLGYYGFGTIGKFLPAKNELTVVKSFTPEGNLGHTPYCENLVAASDGKLYSTTIWGGNDNKGVIFSFDPHSSIYTKLKEFNEYDGLRPYGALIQACDKKLYGMTCYGGRNEVGVIYSFDPLTSRYTKLHDFGLNNEGHSPRGSLIQASDRKLYGMTPEGGSSGAGTIFSFDPFSSTFENLKDFDANNCGYPLGSLMQANDVKVIWDDLLGGWC